MLKVALITLLSLPLFSGFFPKTVHTSIQSVDNTNITLRSSFPVDGMSGVVIHSYDNDLNAITHRITQTSSSSAKLLSADIMHHDELPTIKTAAKIGDKIIGGYLYDNVLLLAPDADTYARVVSQYKDKTWIHPDLFTLYLSTQDEAITTKGNLANFAKKYQVGLICIVQKDNVILLDPISSKVVAKKPISNLPTEGQFPFYSRFDKLDTGWFGTSDIKGNYYLNMGRF